jgi:hypothetical protein
MIIRQAYLFVFFFVPTKKRCSSIYMFFGANNRTVVRTHSCIVPLDTIVHQIKSDMNVDTSFLRVVGILETTN